MAEAHPATGELKRAKLRNSTTVFLVGDLEGTIRWYEGLGFQSRAYPPGFGILRRDEVEIFIQQTNGYKRPDDPLAREREAWSVYIVTDDVAALFEELSRRPEVNIVSPLCAQEYGMTQFDVMDPNGYRLVFAQPSSEHLR
jgi:hypothetical protein